MEGVLEGLNEAQRAAVVSVAPVLQVLAPPGSGKTKTLTARVGHLISHNGMHPGNIIVCTFTVKAAREMQERISGFLGKNVATKLLLGTFHSISRRFLASYGKRINLDQNFSIADTSDTLGILTRIIKKQKLTIDPKAARSRISSLKSQSITVEQFSSSAKHADLQEIAMVYREYEDHLELSKLLDFDDLLLRCAELLRRVPACVSNIEAVLIDEFQDTNNVQYDLMSLFAQQRQNITIVGDPDQSIYGWRNAEIRNLKKMQQQYPETHVAKLEENYRSSGAILLSAQEVIEQDESRPAKRLMPTHSVGMRPVLRKLPSAGAEAAWILAELKRTSALTGGLLRWNDYAILLRSASLSRHVESALGKAGIPYRMVGGQKFFDRMEVKLVLDYLRVISHPEHNDALARILNVPSRKIGDASLERLLGEATERKSTLWDLILNLARGNMQLSPPVSAQAQKGLDLFVNLILTARKKLDALQNDISSFSEYIALVLKKIGLEEHLRRTKPDDFEARWANVQELVAQATDFSEELQRGQVDPSGDDIPNGLAAEESQQVCTMRSALSQFLATVALTTDAQKTDEIQAPTEQVTLSTIHAAKGLEWPVVFIPGAYEGSIPHSRAEDTDEERRLLYVAMTRAQCLLYVSCPLEDSTGKSTKLSPFLAQKPMDSYFDKCGALLGYGITTELAKILRREQPDKHVVEKALSTYLPLRDSQWPLDGRAWGEDDDQQTPPGSDENEPFRNRAFGGVTKWESQYASTAVRGLSRMTSMQAKGAYSMAASTLSTTFVTATTAMTQLQEMQARSTSHDEANRPIRTASAMPRKRKAEDQRPGAGAGGQSALTGFFSTKGRAGHHAEGLSRNHTAAAIEGPTTRHSLGEAPVFRDITNIVAAVADEDAATALTTRPAKILHATSVSSLQQAPPSRRTLGVRRSMNGWAARMGQSK